MANFSGQREMSVQEIENVKLHIEREYRATDVVFLEQTAFFGKYKGNCDGVITEYDFDKVSGLIIEITE